jgi:hypothetical protein
LQLELKVYFNFSSASRNFTDSSFLLKYCFFFFFLPEFSNPNL